MSFIKRFRNAWKAAGTEEPKESKETAEGWIEILGTTTDGKTGQIKIDLDYNEDFVEYLRSKGIQGTSDDVVIQKWITMLYRDIIEQQQEDQRENAVSDFE